MIAGIRTNRPVAMPAAVRVPGPWPAPVNSVVVKPDGWFLAGMEHADFHGRHWTGKDWVRHLDEVFVAAIQINHRATIMSLHVYTIYGSNLVFRFLRSHFMAFGPICGAAHGAGAAPPDLRFLPPARI